MDEKVLIHSIFAMMRSAFTLIELLVTVVVIALLVALLIPAVNMSREAARRTQCVARQRDLAIAMITYNNANNGLPGYLNQLGQTPIHSWAIAVFPNINETKRYEVLMKAWNQQSDLSDEVKQAIAQVPALVCPSDRPEGDARLNYVVNCGPVEHNNNELPFALFRDRRIPLNSTNIKVKLEEIPDGTSNTIILSENLLDVNVWWDGGWYDNVWHNWPPLPPSPSFTRDVTAVEKLGFYWSLTEEKAYAPNSSIGKPRPSSKHPATVVVAFADGSAKPINDDISLGTYKNPGDWLRAVCPDDAKLKDTTF